MKHIALALLTSLLIIICCSCSASPIWNGSEANPPKTGENTDSGTLLPTEKTLPSEDEKNEPQVFTKDFDGIVMTVKTDKSKYQADELIYVDAAVKNTTDEKIHLFVPCLGPDSHAEIGTDIRDGNGSLIDVDTFMKFFEDAVDIVTIEPGGEYVQNMRFETYTGCDTSSRKPAEAGLLSGRCAITLLSDPTSFTKESDYTSYSVDFSLTLI